ERGTQLLDGDRHMGLRFQRERRACINVGASPSLRIEMRSMIVLVASAVLFAAQPAEGQDSSFAALQKRGKVAMGVDQYTSTHKFDALPDGGRIELQRDSDDSVGVAAIRAHIREIARSFSRGDL